MTRHQKGVRGQRHAPAAFYPRERPGTHFTGGWVGPRAGLDSCVKSRPPTGFDPRTVQHIASRCTDYATRPTNLRMSEAISPLPHMQEWFAHWYNPTLYIHELHFVYSTLRTVEVYRFEDCN